MKFKAIYYVYLFIVICVITIIYIMIQRIIFSNKLKKQHKLEDDNYFEMTYDKIEYFLYFLSTVPISLGLYKLVTNAGSKLSIGYKASYIVIIIIITLGTTANLIYKSLIKIVYDNGIITYYLANKAKISANMNDIDSENTFAYTYSKYRIHTEDISCLSFKSGEKIFFRESMKNAYKLVCYLQKRGLYKSRFLK